MMIDVEQKAARYNLSLMGHCTDLASNSLNALLKLATPSQHLVDCGVSFLGLKLNNLYILLHFYVRSILQLPIAVGIIQQEQLYIM